MKRNASGGWGRAERDQAVSSLSSRSARLVVTLTMVVALATLFVIGTCSAQTPETVEIVRSGPDSGRVSVVRFIPPITAADSVVGTIWWMTSTTGKACVTNAGADIFHKPGDALLCAWREKDLR